MTESHYYSAPNPPNCTAPLPAWVVTTGSDHDGYEIAALFADGHDAHRYATWWNREEIRRYGDLSTHATATAIPEEIDFYPTGTWRPPTHPRLTENARAPHLSGSPAGREPTIGGSTDDPFPPTTAQPGVRPRNQDGTV